MSNEFIKHKKTKATWQMPWLFKQIMMLAWEMYILKGKQITLRQHFPQHNHSKGVILLNVDYSNGFCTHCIAVLLFCPFFKDIIGNVVFEVVYQIVEFFGFLRQRQKFSLHLLLTDSIHLGIVLLKAYWVSTTVHQVSIKTWNKYGKQEVAGRCSLNNLKALYADMSKML